MAVPANTKLTYNNLTNPEFVDDMIKFISPDDAPFYNGISKANVNATKPEWLTDTYEATGTNAQLEGDDFAAATFTDPSRVSNNTQILAKRFQVSGTQRAIKSYAVEDTFGYQALKKTKELIRDFETAISSNQAPNVGAAGTARQLRPLESFYATNVSMGVGGANGTATTARTDGTLRSLALGFITTVTQSCYTNGGTPNKLIAAPSIVTAIGALAGTAQRQVKASEVTAYADYIATPFGNLMVVPSRYVRTRTAHLVDMSTKKIGKLRDIKREELAKNGDSHRMQIIGEMTIYEKAEHGNGIIADIQP